MKLFYSFCIYTLFFKGNFINYILQLCGLSTTFIYKVGFDFSVETYICMCVYLYTHTKIYVYKNISIDICISFLSLNFCTLESSRV